MNKTRIFIFNLILLIFLLIFLEIYCYCKQDNEEKKPFFDAYILNPTNNFTQIYKKIEKNEINEIETGFRIPNIISDNKTQKSIILFGCSYTYGTLLNNNQTFSYKLQKSAQRIVYNRAFPGWGIQHMLYQLKLTDFSSSFISPNNVEFIIYTFIDDHVKRLYMPCSFFDDNFIFYKYKNKHLIQKKGFENFYWHSYLLRTLYRNLVYNYINQAPPPHLTIVSHNISHFILLHFLESNNIIRKTFPNAKFIIFVYDGNDRIKTIEKDLKENNIEVIYLSNLSSYDFKKQNYTLDKYGHPSESAWDIIVPLLVKKLKL